MNIEIIFMVFSFTLYTFMSVLGTYYLKGFLIFANKAKLGVSLGVLYYMLQY